MLAGESSASLDQFAERNNTSIVALSRYPDIEVSVYEAAGKLTELGAGVGIFPRTPLLPPCTHQ